MRKKEHLPYLYTYKETRHSGRGIAAFALGFLSLLALGILVYIMILWGDAVGSWIGAAGFTAFAMAFAGMVEGLSSFRDNCRSYIFSRIGTLISAFMVAVWFMVFCVGLAGLGS